MFFSLQAVAKEIVIDLFCIRPSKGVMWKVLTAASADRYYWVIPVHQMMFRDPKKLVMTLNCFYRLVFLFYLVLLEYSVTMMRLYFYLTAIVLLISIASLNLRF